MSSVVDLAQQLIACPSITPEDAGCQAILMERLKKLGFSITPLHFGKVHNFWAQWGTQQPLVVFAGHTDVVPTGDESLWSTPPFGAVIKDTDLYGRGAADMKGSLACMVLACEQLIAEHSDFQGSLGFLITGDEEGPSMDGTAKVMDYLKQHNIKMDYCLVGEPSSVKQLGDTLKIGRRGSLNGKLTVHGIQGHIAYPEKADNPIPKTLQVLDTLCKTTWDQGSEFFPPTSFQISNIHAGTGASNVIPESMVALFNWRFSDAITAESIQKTVHRVLDEAKLKYELVWANSGPAFLTQSKHLIKVCSDAIQAECGILPELSTSGGTSDARFIAPTGCEVVELGPINQSIHQVDECIALKDLAQLTKLYLRILKALLVEK